MSGVGVAGGADGDRSDELFAQVGAAAGVRRGHLLPEQGRVGPDQRRLCVRAPRPRAPLRLAGRGRGPVSPARVRSPGGLLRRPVQGRRRLTVMSTLHKNNKFRSEFNPN